MFELVVFALLVVAFFSDVVAQKKGAYSSQGKKGSGLFYLESAEAVEV